MISLNTIESTGEVSRELIIADAINEKITLYYHNNGKWELVAPETLKHLPSPEESYAQYQTPLASAKERLRQNPFGIPKHNLRVSKGLHIKKSDFNNYLPKKELTEDNTVHEPENNIPAYLDKSKHLTFCPELALALKAWEAIYINGEIENPEKTNKENIQKWLNKQDMTWANSINKSTERIVEMININNGKTKGGAQRWNEIKKQHGFFS